MLADYDYYYAVKRDDAQNITYRHPLARSGCAARSGWWSTSSTWLEPGPAA